MPILQDAHPMLQDRFKRAAKAYSVKNPDRVLRVKQTTRTIAEQKKAFLTGRSKLDPEKKPSMHLFTPSLAIDVWIYEIDPELRPECGYFDSKPGVPADLILVPNGNFPADQITSEYRKFGYEAQSWPDAYWLPGARIVWGGSWAQGNKLDRWKLPKFFDGPHIQLSNRFCVFETQRLLANAGFDPGPLDGLWGGRTRSALGAFCASRSKPLHLVPGRQFPLTPDTWADLWHYDDGMFKNRIEL